MLNLYLLRHGKAANPDKYDKDYDRPLNKKGIVQINQIGYKLQQQENQIDQLISSSAKRTRQTAEIANYYLNIEAVSYHDDLYLASNEIILKKIRSQGKGKSILYAGHNFGISDIASYFADDVYSLSTGMLIHLAFDVHHWNEIGRGSGIVVEAYAPNIYLP